MELNRGKFKRSGYPSSVVVGDAYVFLKTLITDPNNQYELNLGNTAKRELEKPFGDDRLFEQTTYLQGLNLLKAVANSERNKEMAWLAKIQGKLSETLSSSYSNLLTINLNDNPAIFYENFLKLMNDIFDEEKMFRKSLYKIKGSGYRIAERSTQTLYDLLAIELNRSFGAKTMSDAIKDSVGNDIIGIANKEGFKFDAIEQAIIRAMFEIYDKETKESLLNFFKTHAGEAEKVLRNFVEIAKTPSGLQNIIKTGEETTEEIQQNLRDLYKISKNKNRSGLTQDALKKNIKIKGLGEESWETLLQSISGLFDKTLSTGASLRKADVISILGRVDLDVDKMIKNIYSGNSQDISILAKARNYNMVEFAERIEEEYEKIRRQMNDTEELFIIHTSAKDYLAKTEAKGYDAGGGMSVSVFSDFLKKIGFGDTDFLIFALNNLSSESLGADNEPIITAFLSNFIGAFAFDDGITMYSKDVATGAVQKVKGIHLFGLSGYRVPLSFLLTSLHDHLYKEIAGIDRPVLGNKNKWVEVKITKYTGGYGNYIQSMKAEGISQAERWQNVRDAAYNKVQIKMVFLKKLREIVDSFALQ